MNKPTYTCVSVLLAPIALLGGVVLVGGAATTKSQAATAFAAAVCAYANPDPARVAVAMEQLTPEPVDAKRWDEHSVAAGIDPAITFEASSREQRHRVLLQAVQTILTTTTPHSVTTVPIVWWHGRMPTDNDDTTWQIDTVPGWTGTLSDYIDSFVDVYATDPIVLAAGTDDGRACLPAVSSLCTPPTDNDAILATIRMLESGDNYTESRHSRSSGYARGSGNPSGAYQYLYSSWGGYGGYDEAFQAPSAVQDERANNDVATVLERFGSVEWVPIAWYVGSGGAAKVRSGEWPLSYIPNPKYNHISIGDYQAKWMRHYTTVELPGAGVEPVDCPEGAAAVIAWAETQLGAPYAAIDPYRFGSPAWPGGTLIGSRGNSYNFTAGTVVYDCSGFVITAWRQAGIDFPGQYGIYGSQGFLTNRLPDASRAALRPGDIAVYRPDASGVGHVVLIHHVDPDTGVTHTIESSPSYGAHIGRLNWSRVAAIKRAGGSNP